MLSVKLCVCCGFLGANCWFADVGDPVVCTFDSTLDCKEKRGGKKERKKEKKEKKAKVWSTKFAQNR